MHKQIIKYVVNEPETITPPKLLYEFTYPELLEAQKPVVDEKGQLWAGKDRRNTLQDESGKIALWKVWQQSFKTRNVVPQHAMDYFQNTKHLSRPPKEGDVGLVDKSKLVAVSEAPRFTWSPSKLSDFETCPYQFAAKHYYKTIPYQETEATIWGTRVHKQAELAMKEEPITDEEAYAVVKPFVELLRKVPGKRFMEQQMALDENFKPMADWYNGTARMIVDLAIEDGDTVKLFDYKGLALDTKLPTPTGWTTMGKVEVGDMVMGADGKSCQVIGKSQVKNLDCYKLTFSDGATIVCDEEHLWETERGKGTAKITDVKPISELEKMDTIIRVRLAKPLEFPEKDLLAHPYVLGCWLGDGKHTDGSICKPDTELFDSIKNCGYEVGPPHGNEGKKCPSRTVYGLRTALRKLGVLGNKHIPEEYMRASINQRIDLVQGLFDTDGSWNAIRKQAVFVSVNEKLVRQLYELLVSLGERPKIHYVKKRGFGRELMAWDLTYTPYTIPPFRLSRKAAGYNGWICGANRKNRTIHKIEKVESVPTQCIEVDSSDHMYLCGEAMIPTHNTGKMKDDQTQMKIYALVWALHNPAIKKISCKYIWIKDKKTTGFEMTRDELLPVFKEIKAKVDAVKVAWDNENFPARKNGLCKKWCGATECPHCGR